MSNIKNSLAETPAILKPNPATTAEGLSLVPAENC